MLLLIQGAVYFFLQPIIGGALRGSVYYFTKGLYELDYENLEVHLFRQKIALEDVTLSYDTVQVNLSGQKQQKYYTGAIRHVDVKFREIGYFLSGRYLNIDVIDVNQPSVFVHRYLARSRSDTAQNSEPLKFNTFQLIKPYFDSLAVSVVSVKQATLGLIEHHEGHPPDSTSLNDLGMRIVDARIDSVAAQRAHGWPHMQEAVVWMRDQTFTSSDSLYSFRVDSIGVDPLRGHVLVQQLSVVPRWDRYEMGRHLGQLTTWMQWDIARIEVQDLDFPLLTDSLIISAQHASVDRLDVTLFRDLRLPRGEARARPLLPKLLQSVTTPFSIDTLTVAESALRYQEHRDSAERAGQVTFADLYASFYQVTNQTNDSTVVLEADVRTHLMGEGQAELHFEFPLTAPRGEHRIRGKMYRMPLEALNPAVEPLAFASVKSGVANHLDFEMQLNEQSATGEVRFQYEDFKMSLLKKDAPDEKKGMKSWLANWLVIKNSNPVGAKPLRPGPVYALRDSTGSMVRYWWLALRSGLMVSVGVGSPPDDKKSTTARAK